MASLALGVNHKVGLTAPPLTQSIFRSQQPSCVRVSFLPRQTPREPRLSVSSSRLVGKVLCTLDASHHAAASPIEHRSRDAAVSEPQLVNHLVLAIARAVVFAHQAVRRVAAFFQPLSSQEEASLESLRERTGGFLLAAGPLLFASVSQSGVNTSTPLTVIASGMAKWLELYSGLLFIRVLLTWFPNIDWERQPMMAIRDMSDPYLNLFRNVMPPFYNMIDLSPMLGFFVLGLLISLLNTAIF